MFLSILDQDEKLAFFKLATNMAAVDETIAKEEVKILNQIKDELNLNNSSFSNELKKEDISSLCKKIKTNNSKKAAIIELLGLAYADNEFAPEEREFILEISKCFNISEKELSKYIEWVVKLVELINQSKEFFN